MVADSRLSDDESFSIDCPVLVTARLVLRAPHVDDVPDLARLANDRGVADMLGRMPHPYMARPKLPLSSRRAPTPARRAMP